MRQDAIWRANLRRDAEKLGRELTRRRFLGAVGAAMAVEYMALRKTYAMFLRGGYSVPREVKEITNTRTGVTYKYIAQAIYTAETADEIILPAGLGAYHDAAFTPYASWQQLDSTYLRYTAADGWNSMYIGPGHSRADYLSIVGSPSASGARAIISRPFAHLVADFAPGAKTMELDDVTLFTPPHETGAHSGGLLIWGDGSEPSLRVALRRGAGQMGYSGIDLGKNYLTGISGGLPFAIPAGTRITLGPINAQALFCAAAPKPGITFANLEIWGSASWSGTVNAIRMASTPPGSPGLGSISVIGCYFHDNQQGTGLGYAPIGSDVFAHFFDTELYREGYPNGKTHNLYIGSVDELILNNVYSHKTNGTHLIKTRARTGYIDYNCIRGERADANPGEIESCNIDISNGGLYYVIGNQLQQSLNAANQMVNFCAEGPNGASGGAPNPLQELYFVNNTCVGPANGTGYVGSGAGNAPVKLNQEGIPHPATPILSKIAGGTLPNRTYFVQATATTSNEGETIGSPIGATNGSSTTLGVLSVAANNLLEVESIRPATGAVGYNVYANHADPSLYTTMEYPVRQEGNFWFWDSEHTLPIFGEAPGGQTLAALGTVNHGSAIVTALSTIAGIAVGQSVYVGGAATGLSVRSIDNAGSSITLNGAYAGASGRVDLTFASYLYCGFTYDFPGGESANLALLGMSYSGLANGKYYYDGANNRVSSAFYNAALFQARPGMRLVVNAPPSGPLGAKGINFYCSPTPFVAQGGWAVTALTRQNASFIGFGTSWTSRASAVIQSQVMQPNMTRQNGAPIRIGAKWREPMTGLVNADLGRNRLQWRLRTSANSGGAIVEEWWAPAASTLRDYAITIGFQTAVRFAISVVVIRDPANTSWPFDPSVPEPAASHGTPCSVTVSASDQRSIVLAAFSASNGKSRINTSPGFTPVYGGTGQPFMTEYNILSSRGPLNIVEGLGSTNDGDVVVADIVPLGANGAVIGTPVTVNGAGTTARLTVSAEAGDVLVLQMNVNAVAIDHSGVPIINTATTSSPFVHVQNCLLANFDPSLTGGVFVSSQKTYPSGTLKAANNLPVDPHKKANVGEPKWSTVFAGAEQTDFDYQLAAGSPAIGAGSNPGTSLEGKTLAPVNQSQIFGLLKPGALVPPLKPRSNSTWDVGAFEFAPGEGESSGMQSGPSPKHTKDK
jgi:hypothetical protein